MDPLKLGSSGPAVAALQQALRDHGFPPGAIDGDFGPGTAAAVVAFQRSEGLVADGVVGPRTAAALGLAAVPPAPSMLPAVTVEIVTQMFPGTPSRNIAANLPFVLTALADGQMIEKPMVLMSLATIRAETAGFVPINEQPNRFNTSPGGSPFDLYDNRKDLGNTGPPDGSTFRGRGFIQLTGRRNYDVHGRAVGVPALVDTPERANEPDLAARLLASFLAASETQIHNALAADDLQAARRLVNGGTHGVDVFIETYRIGQRLIPETLTASV
jgi:peptidoglycan L-alanyl-D-glutamate endopeptidase CwlK